MLRKACFLYYFRAALKRLAFNLSAMMFYIMKTKIINFKSILPYSWKYGEFTPLFIKWMTSQAYNNDVLLFPREIWKQPHWIKFSDQFRVKVCVCYIFASLFFMPKRKHLWNKEECFSFHLESSFHSWDNHFLTFQIFKCHDVIKCSSMKHETHFTE